ncbi:Cys-tRNA(Pro) deacylase [Pradoshia eiseniae]|uniref:Cys-tRNA(Pro)/Cys-tRNA(Cys) deacylase n=1 Tax=Pradoshia eiseniae TaxID=2064768 RepID=A0A2S7MWB6_9BACI|nr:Cys-tRNA(Pro) deacylase [Pradoshia eiseniae]PQD94059.1 Cys-tRNA(Pro) deacylase [Pradoshia eiseniae]
MAKGKTNAVRMLDQKKVSYELLQYSPDDGKIDGVSVAEKIGEDARHVFKTLVTISSTKNLHIFVIPVTAELDLKRAARVAGEKKMDLLPVSELQKYTGYIRGGCSPVGMKKLYPTFIEKQAEELDHIIVSAGKIGMQMKVGIADLLKVTNGQIASVIHKG